MTIKIRLVGTEDGISRFLSGLGHESKAGENQKFWSPVTTRINDIDYEIHPRLFEKSPSPKYSKGSDTNRFFNHITPYDHLSHQCHAIIFCNLMNEEKEIYNGNHQAKLFDYDSFTTSPKDCLDSIGKDTSKRLTASYSV